jgi:hypothetical protein
MLQKIEVKRQYEELVDLKNLTLSRQKGQIQVRQDIIKRKNLTTTKETDD